MAPRSYRIDVSTPENKRMVTTATLRKGDRILAEEPLVSLDIGLNTLYNPDDFFEETKKYNGTEALETAYNNLTRASQKAVEALYRVEGDNVSSIVSLNAFEYEEEVNGQRHCVLRLYKDLSRLNHSCEPNAIVEWNPTLSKGTLHALVAIPAGQELWIDYMAGAERCLRTTTNRRADLSRYYNFLCECHVCSNNRNGKSANNRLRVRALRLYTEMSDPEDQGDESDEERRVRKVRLATEYVSALETLNLKDGKLAWAKQKLAEYHERGYDFAVDEPGVEHCDVCRDEQSPRGHLDSAAEALEGAFRVHVKCCGRDHPVLEDDRARITELRLVAAGCASP
ncbi:hypothetical protein LTR08_006368 [Meristemomyces frigidus]|nr:hypothetical protein LTR08_006368 [Meristemomyces frigidus]